MRKTIDEQAKIGEVDIKDIVIDMKCRDEMPKILLGLQHIYTKTDVRKKIFAILNDAIPNKIDKKNGRPGMMLWQIFVMATVKVNCDWNYDKLHDAANNHKTMRQLLGLSEFNEQYFNLQTIKDNVILLTPEVLSRIDKIVVDEAHILLKKNDTELRGHCDSFVVKTNVHFPTDINLLFDAMRKTITICARLCKEYGIVGWRQDSYLIRNFKNKMRFIQNCKRSGRKSDENEKKINKAHQEYIDLAGSYLERMRESLSQLEKKSISSRGMAELIVFEKHVKDAKLQIDLIFRRVICGETIAHKEKIFSIFERHTEWISKGKAGVPMELGIPISIIRDQFGLILNYRIMNHEADAAVAVPFTLKTKNLFPKLNECSYDRGYYSLENFQALLKIMGKVTMPKKGKLSGDERVAEKEKEFLANRRKHSVVESSISALINHGLDLCRDKGEKGFNRYIAISIVARNIQILGHFSQQKNLKKLLRKNKAAKKRNSLFYAA